MASGEYDGLTEEELLSMRKAAQKDNFAGASITGSGSGDINATRLIHSNPKARLRGICAALYAIAPERYPQYANYGITQTKGGFC